MVPVSSFSATYSKAADEAAFAVSRRCSFRGCKRPVNFGSVNYNYEKAMNMDYVQRGFAFPFSLTLITGSISCKKETDALTPTPPTGGQGTDKPNSRPGKVCPVGTLPGQATTTTIGPAGGTLTSTDERLTITVPAKTSQTSSHKP